MDDLARWVYTQLDRVEEVALAATPDRWVPRDWSNEHGVNFTVIPDVGEIAPAFAITGPANAAHIALNDPANTLRRVRGLRRIVDRHVAAATHNQSSVSSFVRGQDDGYRQGCLGAVKDVAWMFADQPGYQQGWAPSMGEETL